jgi:hypothetical protein
MQGVTEVTGFRRTCVDDAIPRHNTMEEVVRWGLMAKPPRVVHSIVVQDEYTHDVVMPWGDRFLVYDTT